MFSTTLRIPDELAAFLQEAAQDASLSVNAWLARLLEREQALARQRRLARDWAAYAADPGGQDVEYAAAAQGEVAAERSGSSYQVEAEPPAAPPKPRRRKANP